MWTRKFQYWSTTTGRFINASIIHLRLIVVSQLFIYLPSPLMIDPPHTRDPNMTQICSQLPYLLPLKTLVVPLPPLLYPNNIHVLNKYLPLKGKVHRGYCCMKHGQKICYEKIRFYCSTCYDEDKKFYYCHGFYNISLVTTNCFLEHQHYMSLGYCLLFCLPPFHPLLYLLNFFCACFLPVTMITPCIVFVHCLNACGDNPVRHIGYTGNLHAYVRQLNKGMKIYITA